MVGGVATYRFGDGGVSVVGFTRSTAPGAKDFDFSLRFTKDGVEVRERGVFRSKVNFDATDVFRITLHNGKVTYARNGQVFRTSTAKNITPARVGALLDRGERYLEREETVDPGAVRERLGDREG